MKFRAVLKALAPRLYEHSTNRLRKRATSLLNYERDLIGQLCDREKISLDIGAHEGAYTDFLLNRSQSVVAFEPLPFLAARLRKKYAHDKRVTVHDLALSDDAGRARLRVPVNYPGCSTLEADNPWVAKLPASEQIDAFDVKTAPLDSLHLDNIGFAKIDVEGHEEAVIRGAGATLRRERPSLYIEIDRTHNSAGIPHTIALLREHGYLGYFILQNVLLPASIFSIDAFQPLLGEAGHGKIRINNFFFFHEAEIEGIKDHCHETVFLGLN